MLGRDRMQLREQLMPSCWHLQAQQYKQQQQQQQFPGSQVMTI
jgi:hypothetical protein